MTMKQRNKLSREEEQLNQQVQHSQAAHAPLEFDTPEELLRHDAAQVPVPPSIATRLQDSAAGIAPPRRPWWKRFFG